MDGYMPLEYVDCCKIFSHDSIITTNALDVEADAQFVKTATGNEYVGFNLVASTKTDIVYGSKRLAYYVTGWNNGGLKMVNDSANRTFFPTSPYYDPTNVINSKYDNHIPTAKNRGQYHIHDCGYTLKDEFYEFEPTDVLNNINWGEMRVVSGTSNTGSHWRVWKLKVRQNGVLTADLVPCVRLEDGAPGFWCNVYKKFYDQVPVATTNLNWDEDDDNGVYYLTEEEIAALETEPPVEEIQ